MKGAYIEKEDTPEQIYIFFQEVICCLICDVKIDFSGKDQIVANRVMTEAP